jgi:LmbE family N-acetylglucosaminyl deacetylase
VFDAAALAASAVVFAPHPDDETLACGGTLSKKIDSGASVRLVVVTDGAASGGEAANPLLSQIRRSEALAAAAILGITAEDVRFLEFEDGALASAGGGLLDAIGSVLLRDRPAQIFVPWRHDGHPDHEATFRAAIRAARSASLACDVFEYPVWAWRHWPWVGLPFPRGDGAPPWRATAKFVLGWRFPRTFPATSHIEPTLERKRAALAGYQSQLDIAAAWSLRTVSRGDFLRAFDEPFEVFRRGRLRG